MCVIIYIQSWGYVQTTPMCVYVYIVFINISSSSSSSSNIHIFQRNNMSFSWSGKASCYLWNSMAVDDWCLFNAWLILCAE